MDLGLTSYNYVSYLGGASDDFATGLAIDNNGHAWVSGRTTSANFPAKNYKHGEAQGAAPEGVRKEKVQPGDGRTTVRLASVAKLTGGDAAADPRMFVDLVAHAYRKVAPARRKKL